MITVEGKVVYRDGNSSGFIAVFCQNSPVSHDSIKRMLGQYTCDYPLRFPGQVAELQIFSTIEEPGNVVFLPISVDVPKEACVC